MATEILTVTTAAVTKAGQRLLFPYAYGAPAGSYNPAAAVLKLAGVAQSILFSIAVTDDGLVVTPASINDIPAGVLTLEVPYKPDVEAVDFIALNGASKGVGEWLAGASRGGKFRLKAGAKIAQLGSSSTDNAFSATSSAISANAAGGLNQLRTRFPFFNHISWYDAADTRGNKGANYGFSGQNNAFVATYLDEIITKGYDGVVLQLSQNDLPAGTVPAAIAQVRTMATKARDAGLGVYLVTLNPRAPTGVVNNASVLPLTNYSDYRKLADYNDKLQALADEIGVEFIDTRPYLYDSSTPLMPAKAGVSEDGLHMRPYGHYLWSLAAEPVFRRTIEANNPSLILDPSAAGNLFSNGLLTGTGGAQSALTMPNTTVASTGTLPDKVRGGLSGATTSNSSVIHSIIDDSEFVGAKAIRQEFALNTADATSQFQLLFTDTSASGNTSIATPGMSGKWVRAYLKVFIEKGAETINRLTLLVNTRNTTSGAALYSAFEMGGGPAINGPYFDATMNGKSLWLISDPFVAPDTSEFTQMQFLAQFANTGAGAAALHVSCPAVRVVADPRF